MPPKSDDKPALPRAATQSGERPAVMPHAERDVYAGSRTDVKPLAKGRALAPEVNQGSWRERAFTPRGVMSADEILEGMSRALAEQRANHGPKTVMLAKLREDWLQFLRQAVEQAGGDCLDAWLSAALKPAARRAGADLVLVELHAAFEKMRAAPSAEAMLDLAQTCITAVQQVLEAPTRRPCSFKVLERELEGKIDVDGLILFLLSSDGELTRRATDIGQTVERIRDELKKAPGAKPDGLYSNFARLKAEARVIDGELKRRARART